MLIFSDDPYLSLSNSDKQKADLFEKCRNGEERVLFGSTMKMGAGTNIQKRMIALHDADCPWRPADVGRILRTESNGVPQY